MDWQQRLYNGYISSGQAAGNGSARSVVRSSSYFYYQKIIENYFPKEKKSAIVDLACGSGLFIFCLQQSGYLNVIGVDISPEQVAAAHQLGLESVECADMSNFLKEKHSTYDVIILMDILEHFEKGELLALLDQVYDSLRENGTAVIHVPNAEGLFGMKVRYGDLTHENCFTQQSIRQVLSACRFQKIKCVEVQPVVHGVKSFIRHILWKFLTVAPRLLLTVESGSRNHILSSNMLVIAQRHCV
jgi:SAM-dependent methyltransferase